MLKGERCGTPKCAIERRPTAPGSRTGRPRKLSDYGVRLKEKQKARYTYGVMERQFRKIFGEAAKAPGMTGETLAQLLERRLDNVAYRLGYGDSRNQARQLVLHGHVKVNGRKVDIPSFVVKPGDVIAWNDRSREKDPYKRAMEGIESKLIPGWLSLDMGDLTGRVLSLPTSAETDFKFDHKMIVEHYSR